MARLSFVIGAKNQRLRKVVIVPPIKMLSIICHKVRGRSTRSLPMLLKSQSRSRAIIMLNVISAMTTRVK